MNKEDLAVVILAAGASSRLGKSKLWLKFQDHTLIEHSIQCARSLSDQVFVVLGANAIEDSVKLSKHPISVFINENWQQGLGTSISCATQNIKDNYPINNILFLIVDQPFISQEYLQKLVDSHYSLEHSVTASTYGNTFGIPAIFASDHFDELCQLNADVGAKKLIQKHCNHFLNFPKGAIDIDTEEDLRYLK